jgi:hypothetical protein
MNAYKRGFFGCDRSAAFMPLPCAQVESHPINWGVVNMSGLKRHECRAPVKIE